METATLRIKFTPLFNNALKNGSKCCLEIVPQVSCVQNLDKISWKQEKDLIEYTIPMTYKIILKKRESLNKVNDVLPVDVSELDKTYHSCVDLLPPSSMTTFDFGSGDVTRIISDTFILGKITAKFDDDKTVTNNPGNSINTYAYEIQPNNFPKELPVQKHIVHKQTVFVDDCRADNKNCNAISKHLMSDFNDTSLLENSLNKITNTEKALTVCKVTETQSIETTTEISTRSRDDSKRKLSVSPICSINTNENSFPDTAEEIPLNLVVDRIFQYETNAFRDNVAYKLPTRKEKRIHIKTINDYNNESVDDFYKAHKRELPETRVAKFIKKMEIEIMPLKMMLNDILQKCSTLGLSKNKYIARNLIMYKTVPSCKTQVEKYCKTENQTKSNRVVYSIVFEGVMDNDSVVEQIVRSLSFEVEAVAQDNVIQLTTTTKSAPLNVKIKVRKKEEAGFKHGVLTLPNSNRPGSIPERVRLVSSDQTIMSFNVVVEADFQKPIKKSHKKFLGIFKPTMCLGAQPDEDAYAYLPSKSYKAEICDESTSKSEGTLTKFTLAKNVDNDETSLLPRRNKDIFGKCKPGGCLDPPFGEDRRPYSPAIVKEEPPTSEQATKGTERATKPTTESKGRTSSIFSNKLFNWKRKSSDDGTLDNNVIKKETKAESVLDLYQAGSLQTSTTYANSIMTYPPAFNSSEQLRIQEEKQRGSRTYNDSSKNSFNVHSGSYFIIPKKPKSVLDKNNTVKIENDRDISDLKVDTDDKSNIVQHQVVENDDKHALQTNDSVTDVRGTKEYVVETLDSIKQNDSNQIANDNTALDDIHIPFINTEQMKSKNILLEKDEEHKEQQRHDDLVSQNPSSASYDDIHKSINCSKSDEMREYQSEHNEKPDDLLKPEDITIKKYAMDENEIPVSERVTNNQKSVSLNDSGFETYNENMPQGEIEVENKIGDKSIVTIDAKHEMAIYDITFEDNHDIKPTLVNEINILAEYLGDEGFGEIPTPIERDTPLEIIHIEDNDLQQIWKNKSHPLTSDLEFPTENEFNKQIDPFNKNMDTLDKLIGKGSFDQNFNISDDKKSENQNDFVEDKVKDNTLTIIPNDHDTEKQNEGSVVINFDSQTEENYLQESMEQNALYEDNTLINTNKIDSTSSQKLEDISLQRQVSTTLNEAESEKNKHNNDLPQHETLLEETTELIQTEIPSSITFEETRQKNNDNVNFEEPPIFEYNKNAMDILEYVDDTNEFSQIKYNTEYTKNAEKNSKNVSINHGSEVTSKEPPLYENIQQVQVGDTEMVKLIADHNKINDKYVKKLTFDDDLKVDSKKSEAAPGMTGFNSRIPDEHSFGQTQTSEKNIARPIIVNFAVQSYLDDDNQFTIKSFDADNLPKRYPNDAMRITKRYLEIDDIIQMPIDTQNDLYIQIKTNKQKDINGIDGLNMDTDKAEKATISNKFENDLDHIKRNATIAEDVRKTLEAVYEKELLPLRNTISELKDNVEMLTTHHLLLKGHMFLRKPRSTKIVPLYRRCVCMKK